MPTPFRRELSILIRLSVPIALTQIALMAMGVVDTLMLGHVDKEALGSAALANTWLVGCQLIFQGFLFGLDPVVSQAYGARDRRKLSLTLQRGLLLGVLAAFCSAPLLLFTSDVLQATGQDGSLLSGCQDYAIARIPGLLPFYLFVVLRVWLQGRLILRPLLFTALIGNVVNAIANYALIFGHFGMPELGVHGAGVATSCTQWAVLIALLLIIWKKRLCRGAWSGWSREVFDWRAYLPLIALGFPIAAQLGLEIWAFQISTLAAGKLSVTALASHSIVLNLVSLTFMLPLGIALATGTRVGNLIGAGRHKDAQRSAWTALGMGALTMTSFAALFILGRWQLPALYGAEASVAALAATILPIAAAFQVFDGTQCIAGLILRGMAHPKPVAWFNLFGYYVLGLPLAWYLAFHLEHGLTGIWWGLAVGLLFVSVSLCTYVFFRGPTLAAQASEKT